MDDGRTGFLFDDAQGLAAHMGRLLPDAMRLTAMRHDSRRVYEERYTGAKNYEQLMTVYQRALLWHGFSTRASRDLSRIPIGEATRTG